MRRARPPGVDGRGDVQEGLQGIGGGRDSLQQEGSSNETVAGKGLWFLVLGGKKEGKTSLHLRPLPAEPSKLAFLPRLEEQGIGLTSEPPEEGEGTRTRSDRLIIAPRL